MEEYAGRILAERYRLPLPPQGAPDEYELVETRAFDTRSGQEVLVRQVPLPEIVDAEMLDGHRAPAAGRRPVSELPAVRRAIAAAQAAARVPDHPRLDQVFDVFAEGNSLWIVSELVPARSLAALIADEPLSPYRAAEVAADVLTALRVLHAHGWTHRNITVRTVLVCDDGRVVLTGLAAGAAEEALCGYDPVPVAEADPPGDPRLGEGARQDAAWARGVPVALPGPPPAPTAGRPVPGEHPYGTSEFGSPDLGNPSFGDRGRAPFGAPEPPAEAEPGGYAGSADPAQLGYDAHDAHDDSNGYDGYDGYDDRGPGGPGLGRFASEDPESAPEAHGYGHGPGRGRSEPAPERGAGAGGRVSPGGPGPGLGRFASEEPESGPGPEPEGDIAGGEPPPYAPLVAPGYDTAPLSGPGPGPRGGPTYADHITPEPTAGRPDPKAAARAGAIAAYRAGAQAAARLTEERRAGAAPAEENRPAGSNLPQGYSYPYGGPGAAAWHGATPRRTTPPALPPAETGPPDPTPPPAAAAPGPSDRNAEPPPPAREWSSTPQPGTASSADGHGAPGRGAEALPSAQGWAPAQELDPGTASAGAGPGVPGPGTEALPPAQGWAPAQEPDPGTASAADGPGASGPGTEAPPPAQGWAPARELGPGTASAGAGPGASGPGAEASAPSAYPGADPAVPGGPAWVPQPGAEPSPDQRRDSGAGSDADGLPAGGSGAASSPDRAWARGTGAEGVWASGPERHPAAPSDPDRSWGVGAGSGPSPAPEAEQGWAPGAEAPLGAAAELTGGSEGAAPAPEAEQDWTPGAGSADQAWVPGQGAEANPSHGQGWATGTEFHPQADSERGWTPLPAQSRGDGPHTDAGRSPRAQPPGPERAHSLGPGHDLAPDPAQGLGLGPTSGQAHGLGQAQAPHHGQIAAQTQGVPDHGPGPAQAYAQPPGPERAHSLGPGHDLAPAPGQGPGQGHAPAPGPHQAAPAPGQGQGQGQAHPPALPGRLVLPQGFQEAEVPAPRGGAGGAGAGVGGWAAGPVTALDAERARLTRMAVVGAVTERWAPEQAGPVHDNWQLAAPIGPATDLWALGALLYRAVQGHAPYPEDSVAELVEMVCAEPPAFAEECGPLRPIVESLLRQDPTERPDFEELRGWLRSLVRSAPEPDGGIGIGGFAFPLPEADPARLPVVRRKGDLSHGRHRGTGTQHTTSRPRGGRSLGRTLLLLVLVALAGGVAYAMFFLPKATTGDGDTGGARAQGGPGPTATATPGGAGGVNTPTGTPQSKPAAQSGSPSAPPAADAPAGYTAEQDPEGFRVFVPGGWERHGVNDMGQVRYTNGDFVLILTPGRDAVDGNPDPLSYQRDKERELEPFRTSTWATSTGVKQTKVGQQLSAEGQYTWTDGGGRSVYVRNRVVALGGRYHVVMVIGPQDAQDKVTEVFEKATGSYRPGS